MSLSFSLWRVSSLISFEYFHKVTLSLLLFTSHSLHKFHALLYLKANASKGVFTPTSRQCVYQMFCWFKLEYINIDVYTLMHYNLMTVVLTNKDFKKSFHNCFFGELVWKYPWTHVPSFTYLLVQYLQGNI